MSALLLFGGLLMLMAIQAGVMKDQKRGINEIRDDIAVIKTQLYLLSVAMDATNEKLGEVITEAVQNAVIEAQDDVAAAAEAAIVPDTARTVLDEAA